MLSESAADSIGRLEEEARKRKERLSSLKRKATDSHAENEAGSAEALPKPTFRSYNPNDENLKELKLTQALPETVEDQVKDELEAAKPQDLVEEIDLANLAPRKIDWDLKRNIQKKVDKLEKRTQRAIAELIRDRIKDSLTDADRAGESLP